MPKSFAAHAARARTGCSSPGATSPAEEFADLLANDRTGRCSPHGLGLLPDDWLVADRMAQAAQHLQEDRDVTVHCGPLASSTLTSKRSTVAVIVSGNPDVIVTCRSRGSNFSSLKSNMSMPALSSITYSRVWWMRRRLSRTRFLALFLSGRMLRIPNPDCVLAWKGMLRVLVSTSITIRDFANQRSWIRSRTRGISLGSLTEIFLPIGSELLEKSVISARRPSHSVRPVPRMRSSSRSSRFRGERQKGT